MTNEITTPNSVQDRIKDKIKDTFLDLVSEEEWNVLIKKSIEHFTQDRPGTYSNDKPIKSELHNLTVEVIKEELKPLIKEAMQKFISNEYNDGNPVISDAIGKIIVENAGQIMKGIIGGVIQNTVNNMQYNIS